MLARRPASRAARAYSGYGLARLAVVGDLVQQRRGRGALGHRSAPRAELARRLRISVGAWPVSTTVGRVGHSDCGPGTRPGRGRRRSAWSTLSQHGRERRRLLDQALVVLEPLGLVEGDRGDDRGPCGRRRRRSAGRRSSPGRRPPRRRRCGTPTDLMLTPNWIDQNEGTAGAGAGRPRRQIMLCAAISAWTTRVAPVLERQELVAVDRVREAGDVAGDEDVVGHDRVARRRRGSPASQATPSGPAARPRAAQPLGVADCRRARRRRRRPRAWLPSESVGAAHAAALVALERVDASRRCAGRRRASRCMSRRDRADHAAERARPAARRRARRASPAGRARGTPRRPRSR